MSSSQSAWDNGPANPSSQSSGALLTTALNLYVEHMEEEKSRTRAWIREPNNLISVVAICLSILGVTYGFYKDWRDGLNADLHALSAIVSDLAKLDSDLLTASVTGQAQQQLETTVANRRLILLSEAERLTQQLGRHAPLVQLSILGNAFLENGQYDQAVKYYLLTTASDEPPAVQLAGWRSAAFAYQVQGPTGYDLARKNYAAAAAVFPDPHDYGSITAVAYVYQQWAVLEFMAHQNDAAADKIKAALDIAGRLPCGNPQSTLTKSLATTAQQIIAVLPPGAPSRDIDKAIGMSNCASR